MSARHQDAGAYVRGKASPDAAMERNTQALVGRVGRYYRWNLDVFPLEKGMRILDVGAGLGLYLEALSQYEPERYVATDYSQRIVGQMGMKLEGMRGASAHILDVLHADSVANFGGSEFDCILCFDVLEHIDNHELAASNLANLMRLTRSNHLFLRVPACPYLMYNRKLWMRRRRAYPSD
jgi:2-polyprenyl-3-methyl-5-hydroxy-6-metoxy-1,4-benzoquinol methylase